MLEKGIKFVKSVAVQMFLRIMLLVVVIGVLVGMSLTALVCAILVTFTGHIETLRDLASGSCDMLGKIISTDCQKFTTE